MLKHPKPRKKFLLKVAETQRPKKTGRTKEIGAKDNRAFWLTCGCVAALAIFGLIDVFTERDIMEDSQMLVSFFEIMKYVITTSLGFFFATTVTKNE